MEKITVKGNKFHGDYIISTHRKLNRAILSAHQNCCEACQCAGPTILGNQAAMTAFHYYRYQDLTIHEGTGRIKPPTILINLRDKLPGAKAPSKGES